MDEIHSQNSVEIDMSLETHLEGATVQDHSTSTNNDPLVSDLNINKTLIPDDDLKKDKDKIKRRRSSYGHHISRRSICTKYMRIKYIFRRRTKKLKTEYSAWRNLIKSRRAKLSEALRKEKLSWKKKIFLPELRNHIKTITLSQPDYNQYLREINFVREKALLTKLEVVRVTSMTESFLKLSKLYSQKSFEILEKEVFGEIKDPRVILKALQEG
ncbi:hypothetical protein Avbf_14021 [Armadillidium vulgare]|nr:hypothetical protein Avbf_14021 [Armadillidium vulgare]